MSTYQDKEWKGVIDVLERKHSDMEVNILCSVGSVTNSLVGIQEHKPRYLAFVMKPEEVDAQTVFNLRDIIRSIDSDPYDDAIWGIISGPTAADAKRIASSNEPKRIVNVVANTGVDASYCSGEAVGMNDHFKDGESDTSEVFAGAWDRLDPELIVTSSHASQGNLEMPFSRGNIVPLADGFATCPDLKLIDYRTGQYRADAPKTETGRKLKAPKNEKVWIAAGNCLIADNLPRFKNTMIMTALGFGKVNQFMGYVKTTWFGEIGWNTLGYFHDYRYPLTESYFFANQNLLRTLPFTEKDSQEQLGKEWDKSGTVLYADPVQKVKLDGEKSPEWNECALPMGIVFEKAVKGRKLVKAPKGFEVMVADDFALVTKWPNPLPEDWRKSLIFEPNR